MGKKIKHAISPTRDEDYSEWYQQAVGAFAALVLSQCPDGHSLFFHRRTWIIAEKEN